MDSRLWSESLPEPSGEWQVVLGLPESFRAAQNTTCYVRLNINFQCLEITIQQSKFYSNISIGALVITLVGYLFITNKQIKQ